VKPPPMDIDSDPSPTESTQEQHPSSEMSEKAPETPNYPSYTEANPMKLPQEEASDFILGLDLGNTTSVVSISKKGELSHHPYVLHNGLGDLTHAPLVSYTDTRILGADATSQLVLNPSQTLFDLKFLNLHHAAASERTRYPFDLLLHDGFVTGVRVDADYLGGEKELHWAQVLGSLIKTFAAYAQSDMLYWQFREKILRQRIPRSVPVEKRQPTGLPVRQCVVAVPACYSAQQRASVLDAGAIAGVDVVGLVDEAVASALTYTTSRRHELKGASEAYPESVIVVDMGQSFFQVAITQVGPDRMKILHSSAVEIGVHTLQSRLEDTLTTKLRAKFALDGPLSHRTLARLRRSVEKTMRVLSTVAQSHVEIENFADGQDARESISRAEFESLCESLCSQLGAHMKEALAHAGMAPSSELKVEVVGGGCRIPMIQRTIMEATGVDSLHYNLDSNNSVAVGAAIYGALCQYDGPYDLEDASFTLEGPQGMPTEEVQAYRMPAETLAQAQTQEEEMGQRDAERQQANELRNKMEQYIYQYEETLASIPTTPEESRSVLLAEKQAVEPLLAQEKDWLLYGTESAVLSLKELEDHFVEFKQKLASAATHWEELREAQRIQQEEQERQAAEEEANRAVTYRDKVKNPKTPKERVDAATARKDQGNTFFKDMNYEHAIMRYLQAINLLAEVQGEKYTEEITRTQLSCYLNLAMSYLNLKKFSLSIENCNLALRLEEKNVKALFRRGKAKFGLKQYAEAKEDFELALQYEPTNTTAKKQSALCDKQMKLQRDREKKMYAKMFS